MQSCGVFYIGRSDENGTRFCPQTSGGGAGGGDQGGASTAGVTLEVVIELYIITTVCVIGIIGNVVSVVVLRKDQERKEAMILLQILACADAFYLLVALLNSPLQHLIPSSYTYTHITLYTYPLLKLAQTVCVWQMVLVTVDRYVYVCMPLRAIRILTPRRRRLLAVGVVVCAVVYNLPRFFDSCLIVFQNACTDQVMVAQKIYTPKFNSATYYNIYICGAYTVLLFALPLTCLTFLNWKLIKAIRRSRQRHLEVGGPQEQTESNATLVLVIIVVVFIICETPEFVINVLTIIDRLVEAVDLSVEGLMTATRISELLMTVNSSSNFFIYLLLGNRFRLTIKSMIQRVVPSASAPSTTVETVPLQNS